MGLDIHDGLHFFGGSDHVRMIKFTGSFIAQRITSRFNGTFNRAAGRNYPAQRRLFMETILTSAADQSPPLCQRGNYGSQSVNGATQPRPLQFTGARHRCLFKQT